MNFESLIRGALANSSRVAGYIKHLVTTEDVKAAEAHPAMTPPGDSKTWSKASDSAPLLFISHGSEDKPMFVLPLAESLYRHGVRAWLDRWEIRPGDSLVSKIFDEGLGKADAFVVVLSETSVVKPWVREELNAAVVARIERSSRLIPVRLDQVEVPNALRGTLWIDANRTPESAAQVAAQIARLIHGQDPRPALGPMPAHLKARSRVPGLGDEEHAVMRVLLEDAVRFGSIQPHRWKQVVRSAESEGLDPRKAYEAGFVLLMFQIIECGRGKLDGNAEIRLTREGLIEGWLASRPDRDDVRNRIVHELISRRPKDAAELAERVGEIELIVEHFLADLERQDLVSLKRRDGAPTRINDYSPKLKRLDYR
jgi:hypothetical protein